MSKGIASYPEHMRPTVVARRMKAYDPDGFNGIGTLAAKQQYDRQTIGTKLKKARKVLKDGGSVKEALDV